MKIRLVEAELFHADGRTHERKLTFVFGGAGNALKNLLSIFSSSIYKFTVLLAINHVTKLHIFFTHSLNVKVRVDEVFRCFV